MKKKILLTSVALIILISGIAVVSGYWPVALAGWTLITSADFEKAYGATTHFYGNNMKLYKEDPSILQSDGVKNELKRAVLDSLIESAIVDKELSRRYNASELAMMVDEKIDKTDINSKDVQNGSEFLYGLRSGDFKETVLIPKAKQEIMQGILFLENKNYDTWVAEKKSGSNVLVFIPKLYWDKREVKIRQ